MFDIEKMKKAGISQGLGFRLGKNRVSGVY